MEEKQKVYIKGVQGRGEEVKQALINLGGYVVRDYNYTVSDCLYYINHNEEIRCTEKTTEIGKIIMDNYKEIKLSGQWSDGDILVRKDNNKVFELPFAIGDKVWFIVDNEVHEGTLTECNITINKDDTQICYNVLYYNRIHCKVLAKGIASNKLFKTKTELLESL